MAWIELHQEFRDHTKVKRLARELKCNPLEAAGLIIYLWLWAAGEAKDGDLSRFADWEIVEGCHATHYDPALLKKALLMTQILDEVDLKILIHDWKKHGLRVLEGSRRRAAKSRKSNTLEARTVTLPLRDGTALLSLFLSSLSFYSLLSTKDFATAWGEWIKHRKEKRKSLTESQAIKQLKWLDAQLNPIACIEQSIRNGWQGLFELKGAAQLPPKQRKMFTCSICEKTMFDSDRYNPEIHPCKLVGKIPDDVKQSISKLAESMHIDPQKGERQR